MTPKQKLKNEMLIRAAESENIYIVEQVTKENVDSLYETLLVDADLHYDCKSEMRCGQVETGLPCEYSCHYESKSVASQMSDGSWVGWTYWYGGGKHGEPEAIDWMDEAYFLDCAEEQKMVTVRTFTTKA